jgi:hypothetical protein
MLSNRSAACRMLELPCGAALPATPRMRGSTMHQA